MFIVEGKKNINRLEKKRLTFPGDYFVDIRVLPHDFDILFLSKPIVLA